MNKNLIIFDWDDTLFPTYWVVQNKINIADEKDRNKYIVLFSKLDLLLYNILEKCTKVGDVVIVTNATAKWIMISSSIIPMTQKLLRSKILVISARDAYQKRFPDQMNLWKKKVFANTINNKYNNVISVGDAEYEFYALIDLYNYKNYLKQQLLKTVKLNREPSFNDLIDELTIFNTSISKIVTHKNHIDLQFKLN